VTELTEVTEDFENPNLDQPYPMTVRVLIRKLRTCHPDKPVRLCVDGFNMMDMPDDGVCEGPDDVMLGRLDASMWTTVDELPEEDDE